MDGFKHHKLSQVIKSGEGFLQVCRMYHLVTTESRYEQFWWSTATVSLQSRDHHQSFRWPLGVAFYKPLFFAKSIAIYCCRSVVPAIETLPWLGQGWEPRVTPPTQPWSACRRPQGTRRHKPPPGQGYFFKELPKSAWKSLTASRDPDLTFCTGFETHFIKREWKFY